MWSKNGSPVPTSARPGPSRSTATRTRVSLVSRRFSERRIEGIQKGVVLVRRADRDPEAAFERGTRREVAHEDRTLQEPLPETGAVAISGPEEEEVGPRRPDVHTRPGAELPIEALPLGGEGA